MKFPIYRVEFKLFSVELKQTYEDTGEVVTQKGVAAAHVEQNMMLRREFADHIDAEESLRDMVSSLAVRLEVDDKELTWIGSICFDRMDTWCLHYDSHYTYRRFSTKQEALLDFLDYKLRHFDEVKTEPDKWHVCPCEVCVELGRTMILHEGENKCPTCFSVS